MMDILGAAAIQAFIMTTAGLLGEEAIPGDPNLFLLEVAGRAKLKAAEKGVHPGFREQGVKDKGGKFSRARNVCLRKAVLKRAA